MTRIIEIKRIESSEVNDTEHESKDIPRFQFRPIEIDFDQNVIRSRAAVDYFKNIMLHKDSSTSIHPCEMRKLETHTPIKIFTSAAFESDHTCKRMKVV